MGKRVLVSRQAVNILLSAVLVLGLLPVPAFAEGSGGENAPAVSTAGIRSSYADKMDDSSGGTLATSSKANTQNSDASLVSDAAAVNESVSPDDLASDATLTPGWTQSGT